MSEPVQPASQPTIAERTQRNYLRFKRVQRIEHWVFMASFTTLGITGLVRSTLPRRFRKPSSRAWVVLRTLA